MKLKLWGVWLAAGLLAGCSGSAPEKEAQVSEAGQTRLQLGLEYLQQGDMDAARQNLEKALDAAPQDYRTQLGMALYEQRIGENAAAEQRYRQALKLAPGNGTVLNNYGAFLCGLGQYVPAQQQFSAAALAPDYGQVADSLENAGYCFLKAGQNDEARTLLSRALKVDPTKALRCWRRPKSNLEKGSAPSRNFYWMFISMFCRPAPAAYGYRFVSPR